MSVLALARAMRAHTPAGVEVHVGEAPPSATLPWVVLNAKVPGVRERAEASTPLAGVARLAATIAATSEDAVLVVADKVIVAFEGARPVAPGWACSPLVQVPETVNVYSDSVTIAGTNRRVAVAALMFETTVSRTA